MRMLASMIVLGVVASTAGATEPTPRPTPKTPKPKAPAKPKPLDGCAKVASIAPDTRIAAERHVTYAIGTLRVCVVKAVYPYRGPGKGHRLLSCYLASDGKRTQRLCGDGNTSTPFGDYRIEVTLRRPHFTDSSEVWLRVVPAKP